MRKPFDDRDGLVLLQNLETQLAEIGDGTDAHLERASGRNEAGQCHVEHVAARGDIGDHEAAVALRIDQLQIRTIGCVAAAERHGDLGEPHGGIETGWQTHHTLDSAGRAGQKDRLAERDNLTLSHEDLPIDAGVAFATEQQREAVGHDRDEEPAVARGDRGKRRADDLDAHATVLTVRRAGESHRALHHGAWRLVFGRQNQAHLAELDRLADLDRRWPRRGLEPRQRCDDEVAARRHAREDEAAIALRVAELQVGPQRRLLGAQGDRYLGVAPGIVETGGQSHHALDGAGLAGEQH